MIFLRGGYLLSPDTPSEEVIYTFTAGGGINLSLGQALNLSVDYAYRAAEFLGDNQVFAVRVGL
jgi:hypothetical protein